MDLLLDPLRRIMEEYKTLLVNMCNDAVVKEPKLTAKQRTAKDSARHNYSLLCDLGTLLSLSCFMPLLEYVEVLGSLMHFAQSNHVFVCDYLIVVRICQGELYMMYGDPKTSFQRTHFQMFCDVLNDHSYTISQEWVTDLNTSNETLSFCVGGHTYLVHSLCFLTSKKLPISHSDFVNIVSSVKGQYHEAALLLRGELDRHFPNSDLMCALGVVFPQYWLQGNADEFFPLYMKTIHDHYCVGRSLNRGTDEEPCVKQIEPLLDTRTLDLQSLLFKLTMKSNYKSAIEEPHDQNPLTKMWQRIGQNALMLNRLSEFIKLCEIAVTVVLGSMEDEHTFSTLGFMKLKLRNRLGSHLDMCVKVFVQQFYNQGTFPYQQAITHWRNERDRRSADL
jgi:hypothetical protein